MTSYAYVVPLSGRTLDDDLMMDHVRRDAAEQLREAAAGEGLTLGEPTFSVVRSSGIPLSYWREVPRPWWQRLLGYRRRWVEEEVAGPEGLLRAEAEVL